ncbi:MAG: CsgG/HfaB family protein [Planctomycetota bacterium]
MMRASTICLVTGMVLVTIGGCSKRREASVTQFPQWEFQSFRRVAVLPFQMHDITAGKAAQQAEFYLVDRLAGSGAFDVATRSDLGALMSEQDLSRLAGVADPTTAMPEGMLQIAQALVIGTITEFDLKQERIERRVPRYARDRKGRVIRHRDGRPVVTGEDVYMEYRHVARVGGNMRVIDAATGRVLLSHSVAPIEKDDFQRGTPPRATPEDLAIDVAREIATEFYRKIAPQSVEMDISGDCLLIAAMYYEGRYDKIKKVPRTLDEILLVATGLPRECDRNTFRLAISSKDEHGYLVEHEFIWSPSLGQRGEVVRVPVTLLAESGHEKFTAKLFVVGNEEPVVERDFELVEPGEE